MGKTDILAKYGISGTDSILKKYGIEKKAGANAPASGALKSLAAPAGAIENTKPLALSAPKVETMDEKQLKQRRAQLMSRQGELQAPDRIAFDTTELERVNKELHEVNTRLEEMGKQGFNSRLNSVLSAGLKGTAAQFTNLGGLMVDTANEAVDLWESDAKKVAKQRADTTREILRTGVLTDGRPVTDAMRPALEEMLAKYEAEYAAAEEKQAFEVRHPQLTKAEEKIYEAEDKLDTSAEKDVQKAKKGLGAAGQFAVDAGVAATQLAGDIGLASLTGGSTVVPMAARVMGGSAQEARKESADVSDQLRYGTFSALASGLTERLGNVGVFKHAFGSGVLDKAIAKIAQKPAGKLIASAASEGLEEFVESLAQPILKQMTYAPEAKYDEEWLTEALYGAAIGAVLGSGGAAVSPSTYGGEAVVDAQEGTEAVKPLAAPDLDAKKEAVEQPMYLKTAEALAAERDAEGEQSVSGQNKSATPNKGEAAEVVEVRAAYKDIRKARKAVEKAVSKNLLTDYDNAQVGRLLKGEIALEDLDPEKVNVHGVKQVFEAKQEYERLNAVIKKYNQGRKAKLREEADADLATANEWKDKPAGILYARETMERNIRDIVPDRVTADAIIRKYFTPVHDAQAESTRMKNAYRDRVRALNLSRKVAEGNEVSEAHAVQLLGEAEDNIRVLQESKGRVKERDGKKLEEWQAIVSDLWQKNPNLDQTKVRGAVAEFRAIYDELFQQMNEARLRNGYEPVAYRQGYFPHFQPGTNEGLLDAFGKALGIETEVTALPTTINGLTHTFRPGITWFGHAQERMGFSTAYDAVEGFDKYIEGASDVIHQTDNIQRLRALTSQMRYRTSDEGIRKQVDAVMENDSLTEEDKQNRIDKIYESGRYTLSNFVVELEEYTNLLANKKSRADRNMEQAIGRRMYNLTKALENRVAANMVAINPASWLTNFIPITQGMATVDTNTMMRAMWKTLRSYKEDDGFVNRSSFLTNRRGSDPIVRTWAQGASAKMSLPMEYIDQFTADTLVRARYQQNIDRGLSEAEAMSEADAWAAGVMADRSKGATPTLFNRKSPLTKLFTQFQLEVNNQLSYLFKDVPDELKEAGAKALAAGLLKFFIGSFLYNEVYEYVIGRRPALDPIGILNDTVGDLTGYELPNLVGAGADLLAGETPNFKTQKKDGYEAVKGLATATAEGMPFVGGLLGGGRLPISSALPDFANLGKAVFSDSWDDKKRRSTIAKELAAPATYLVAPFGGGQIKKIFQGLKAVAKGGSYSVDSSGRDIMQYPVFNDTAADVAGNAARAVLFGKSSLPTAQEWVEDGFDSYGAKQTAVYQGMNDAGVSDREAYALLEDLRAAKKTAVESVDTIRRRILRNSDISPEGKAVAYYGMLASEGEIAVMDALAETDTDMGQVTEVLMTLRDENLRKGHQATKAQRNALISAKLDDETKRYIYREIITDGKEEEIDSFVAVGGSFGSWLRFEKETAGLESDAWRTKKQKVLAAIDKMDLSEPQKDALYLAAGYSENTINEAPWRISEYQKYKLKLPDLNLPDLNIPDLDIRKLPAP